MPDNVAANHLGESLAARPPLPETLLAPGGAKLGTVG